MRISSSVMSSGRLESAIVPPCFSTIHLAIGRPRPFPKECRCCDRVPPIKAFEDVGQLVTRDAHPMVAHFDDRLAVGLGERQIHARFGVGVDA
jgi:hypothetical protein